MHWDAHIYMVIALGLSLAIGAEREFFAKPAGIRTTSLVGLGSCLFTLVSREGLWLLPGMTTTAADGSRVAAQIVSGVGFLGAGLIFVRRDAVRGLTTAAGVWFVAAVGMAVGAGVPDLAVGATILYLIVTVGVRPISKHLPKTRAARGTLRITYLDGHGILRSIMEMVGSFNVRVDDLEVVRSMAPAAEAPSQTVRLEVTGAGIEALLQDLTLLDGVLGVQSERGSGEDDSRS